jgi:hypothetical protein
MKADWIQYPRGRKAARRGEHVVIVPESYSGNEKRMSLFCEVCGIRYRSQEDEKTFEEFGCCVPCADTWAYSRREEWTKGWRPSAEQVKISVERRTLVDSSLVFE